MQSGIRDGAANRPHGGLGLAVCGAWVALAAALPSSSRAQGQDSTVAERNLLVMAELLPGLYDNANQAYFDRRRGLPEDDRHRRVSVEIRRVDAPAFGRYAFLWSSTATAADGQAQREDRIVTLAAGPGDDEVTMRHYLRMQGLITVEELADLRPGDLRRTDGCDYVFKRRADHFRGVQTPRACRFEWQGNEVYTDNEIQLSRSSLWYVDHKFAATTAVRLTGVGSGEPYWLERARVFHCYADIPGVGGGRNIPFERYDDIRLHDKGGTHWFRTRPTAAEPGSRELGISLQAVTWHVLNERNGNFNRNSLVLYVMERLPDGSVKEHGYAFTDPGAERIGHNLKWILVNCAITPRDQARPEM
jgi:hypothetical protein